MTFRSPLSFSRVAKTTDFLWKHRRVWVFRSRETVEIVVEVVFRRKGVPKFPTVIEVLTVNQICHRASSFFGRKEYTGRFFTPFKMVLEDSLRQVGSSQS